jgi:hypothetical protein
VPLGKLERIYAIELAVDRIAKQRLYGGRYRRIGRLTKHGHEVSGLGGHGLPSSAAKRHLSLDRIP